MITIKKQITTLLLLSIIIYSLAIASTTQLSKAQGGTQVGGTSVSGIIANDTIWDQTNSPYVLAGNVLVKNGATLTIDPGVTVYLDDHCLRVNGTLKAIGTIDNRISFIATKPTLFSGEGVIVFLNESSDWNEQTKTGCIIQNAVITACQPVPTILIMGASVKIDHCSIISTAEYTFLPFFSSAGAAIQIYSSTDYQSPQIISNNTIGNYNVAIYDDSYNSSYILNNYVFNCDAFYRTWHVNSSLMGNLVENCGTGIYISSSAREINKIKFNIFNNTFNDNGVAISISLSVDSYNESLLLNGITYNNFVNNFGSIVSTVSNANKTLLNATYNWWGTTDIQDITSTINNNNGYPVYNPTGILFMPLLTAMNNDAPSLDYNPNPNSPNLTTYTITVTHVGSGTVSPSDEQLIYGSTITLTAAPAPNYAFMCWLQDGLLLSEENPYNYTVTGNHTITAVFYDPVAKDSPTPTPTPTQAHTSNPTSNPTTNPTAKPTTSPTQTPTSSPSPSPTIPEFPAITLLPLLLAALSLALVLRKRTQRQL